MVGIVVVSMGVIIVMFIVGGLWQRAYRQCHISFATVVVTLAGLFLIQCSTPIIGLSGLTICVAMYLLGTVWKRSPTPH